MIDISKITEHVYVGSSIGKDHVEELKVMKFDLIISMICQAAPDEVYMLPPFKTIWIKTYDTFFTPISVRKLLVGVNAALPVIRRDGKVLIFCMQGKRRSVIMAAAILISEGHPSEEAIDLLIKSRKAADPRRWYVHGQILAFERYWKKNKPQPEIPNRTVPP